MKPSWTWSLALIATLGLGACGHLDTTGEAAREKAAAKAPTGPAGDASSLTAYHWRLIQAFTPQGGEDQSWFLTAGSGKPPLQLDFADRRLAVKNLCNVVTTGYSTEGQRIATQRAVSTLMACTDDQIMLLEQKVARILPLAKQWAVQLGEGQQAPRLTLGFIDGTRWVLEGAPTAQTQYGSAGERIFLEVAPQRVACSHPLIKDFQCLRVREIRYGDNGVKTHTGEWENFYSEIEGYKHEPGIRNVLRIQRFKRQNVPADASAYAYVLDMVVESERADR
jgi:heat shock protein HslJ